MYMNRIKLSILSAITTFSLGIVAFNNKQSIVNLKAYPSGDASTYYNSISDEDIGNALLTELQNLNSAKRQSLVGYDNMPTKFQQTDPGARSGEVTSFYSGNSSIYRNKMNREHVWPASKTVGGRGNDPLEDDIHMTRPTLISENSSRGNSFFVEGMYSQNDGWDPAMASFGDETYRGDSARIIFYSVVADSRLSLVDKERDSNVNHTMGKLSDLLVWNLKYPVQQRERVRNEAAESLQGNRNPFIDHPEYACRIWGNYNQYTMKSCAGYGVNGHLDIRQNNVTLDSYSMEELDEVSFTSYYKNASNPDYSWTITSVAGGTDYSTSDVISISANANTVTVRAISEGTAYLKSKITSSLPSGGTEELWSIIQLVVYPVSDLTGLQLVSFPNKTTYEIGESFNPQGLKINASFSDGRTVDVTNEVTFTGFDTSSSGKKVVTASYSYKGVVKSTTFNIYVNKAPAPSKSGGCGGDIVTSSVLLSSLSFISAFLVTISIKKKKKK